MRSTNESFVARHAGALPGLQLVLDPERLARLAVQYSGAKQPALHLKPSYLRFKQGSSCLVGYQGQLGGRTFHCYAKAIAPMNAVKLEKISRRPTVPGPLGPGRIVFEDWLTVLWFFPNDHALRGLHRYCTTNDDMHRLSYKPERRFVGLQGMESHAPEVVKFYKRTAFGESLARARIAEHLPFMPNIAGYDEKLLAIRLHWKPGTTLTVQIQKDPRAHEVVHSTGRLLGALHELPVSSGLVCTTPYAEQRRLAGLASDLSAIAPEMTQRGEALRDALTEALDRDRTDNVFCHGDFYANQVLLTEHGINLLDFDELSLAPGESDIGLFLAHLEFDVLRGRLTQSACERLGESLLAGYLQCRRLSRPLVDAYTAFGMFQLAHRPFRDQMENWPTLTRHWMDRIEQHLGKYQSGVAVVMTAGAAQRALLAKPREDSIPQLEPALSKAIGFTLIDEILKEVPDKLSAMRVEHATTLRVRPGRRAVVAYGLTDLAGAPTQRLVGKIRVKGLDTRTFELNRRLHAATQSEDGPLPLRLPRPVGCIPSLNMWLQEWIEGRNGWLALDAPNALQLAAQIARALYRFHTLSGQVDRAHTWREELGILEPRLAGAAEAMPGRRGRLDRLRANCRRLAGLLPPRPMVGLHRDFYPDQLILTEHGIYLLDLDLHCRGDAAIDIGNFIAHIQERDLRVLQDPHAHESFCLQFRNAYDECADSRGFLLATEIYRALSLARLVHISTTLEARRPHSVEILTYCEAVVDGLLEQLTTTTENETEW